MAVKRERVHIESIEEILGNKRSEPVREFVCVEELHTFVHHPYKVLDDERMDELVDSIRLNGIITPILIRKRKTDGYEVISGHRRVHASKRLGLPSIPAIITEMTDDEAVVAMVDSNVQRTEILPSEKAWSLRMKMEALKRQGERRDLTSGHDDPKLTSDEIGRSEGISGRQVKRYVRLTELIPELLDLVDKKTITIVIGVEISFLPQNVQKWVFEYLIENGSICKLQIEALRGISNIDNITKYTFIATMNNSMPKNKIKRGVNLTEETLNRYFPKRMAAAERERIIIGLLEEWKICCKGK